MWANCQDDVCGIHVEDAIDWLEKQGKTSQILSDSSNIGNKEKYESTRINRLIK